MSNSENVDLDLNITGVTIRARDKDKGMTLDEMAAAIQTAMRINLPGDARLKVTIGWHGQIQQIILGAAR